MIDTSDVSGEVTAQDIAAGKNSRGDAYRCAFVRSALRAIGLEVPPYGVYEGELTTPLLSCSQTRARLREPMDGGYRDTVWYPIPKAVTAFIRAVDAGKDVGHFTWSLGPPTNVYEHPGNQDS